MGLSEKTICIDLISMLPSDGYLRKGASDEQRSNCIITAIELPAHASISNLCQSIRRQYTYSKLLMSRPVCNDVFRTTGIPRIAARNRSIVELFTHKPVPHGISMPQNFSQHAGKGKRKSQLENLCRLRKYFNRDGSKTLCERTDSSRTRQYGLRPGFNNHRPLPVNIPMSKIPSPQGCNQAPYFNEFAWSNSGVYPYFTRQNARCESFGFTPANARSLLCHGSRISRLREALCVASSQSIFRNKGHRKSKTHSAIFKSRGQNHGPAMRPDRCADRAVIKTKISRATETNQILRGQKRQAADLFNQRFRTVCLNHRTALQIQMGHRGIFQMDQAAPSDQVVLRH